MPRKPHHTRSAPSSQVPPMMDADLWHTEVVPLLPADVAAQARSWGAFTCRRELACASDLLRGLCAYVLVAASFQHLGAWGVLAEVASLSAPAEIPFSSRRRHGCWAL
jgi:hypothetical protein